MPASYPKDVKSRLRCHNSVLKLYFLACRKGQTGNCNELLTILARELYCVARRLHGTERETFTKRADHYLACRKPLGPVENGNTLNNDR